MGFGQIPGTQLESSRHTVKQPRHSPIVGAAVLLLLLGFAWLHPVRPEVGRPKVVHARPAAAAPRPAEPAAVSTPRASASGS